MCKFYCFQVNLGGMLDMLSNHLYKSPDVFLRELLQNGVDAITLRQKQQNGWNGGKLTISVEPGQKLVFRDNGAGLSKEGIHRFLAVIGQSSKTEIVNGRIPEDYIGRFGIGLLSCFMVSDSIVVHTRPADGGDAHVWTGRANGTYTLEPLADCPVGTSVILTAKPGAEHYFEEDLVEQFVCYYGLALPAPIYLGGSAQRLNSIPADFSGISHSQLLQFGQWLFHEEFIEAIPIHTSHLDGVAYVLPYCTDVSMKGGHRIYLKQMLLTEQGEPLLPAWAFFLRCFLKTNCLRPTASRESFYEDTELYAAQEEFSQAVRSYLERLVYEAPQRMEQIVQTHMLAIKSMAVWDENLFRLFIDYLPFETSEGAMTGGALKRAGEAVWVGTVLRFQQLRPIFMAQGRLLICTGYTYDTELITKLAKAYTLQITPLQEDSMDFVLEELTVSERRQTNDFLRLANRALAEFDCIASLRRFLPTNLPTLYAISEDTQFYHHMQKAQQVSSSVFSSALSSLLAEMEERPLATLFLNLNSPLVERMAQMQDGVVPESLVRVLYIQALLAGGHPLRGQERTAMNQDLLRLIDDTTL